MDYFEKKSRCQVSWTASIFRITVCMMDLTNTLESLFNYKYIELFVYIKKLEVESYLIFEYAITFQVTKRF